MAKIKLYLRVTDGGDGEHHACSFPNKESQYGDADEEGFPPWGGVPYEFDEQVINLDDYEIIED